MVAPGDLHVTIHLLLFFRIHFQFLWKELKTKVTVKELCGVLELPRSTFYRWLQRTERLRDDIEEKIKEFCLRHKLRYGYRRVTATLRKNHKKVLRIMKQYQILSKVCRKKKKYVHGAEPVVAINNYGCL